MNTPKFCYLDIETIPKGKREEVKYPLHPKPEDVKVGNRKGETAEAYRKQKYPELVEYWAKLCEDISVKEEDKFRKRALVSHQSIIICLAYAFDDGEIEVLTGTEKDILTQFEAILDQFGDKKYAISFVGHNVREFDLKRLYHRALLYNLNSLKNVFKCMPKDRVYDTMEMWAFHSYRDYISLSDLLEYFGFEGKEDMDGSMVYDFYLANDMETIYKYCKSDVEKVRQLFKVLS